jgi:hypothetical protein
MQIVREAESARGWVPGPALSKTEEARQGCDFFSQPPDGGAPHPVEVKGWGDPLLTPDGRFTYDADINAEQHQRAEHDPNWRLEIVGNLAAVRASTGEPQRLTLSASDIRQRARPWRYKVRLDGLADRVRA